MIDRVLGELTSALRVDGAAAGRAMQTVWREVGSADAIASSRALMRVGGMFDGLPPGRGSRLAVLAGALVERGADPAPAVPAVVDGWLEASQAAGGFARRWRAAVRVAPPEPVDDPATFEAVVARLAGDGPVDAELRRLVAAWFMLGQWTMALTTFLQRAAVRTGLPRREEVEDAVETLQDVRYDLDWLVDLMRVLDDEEILVLHRPSGRGWALTVGGVGDNFQLHTLLAATLVSRTDDRLILGMPPSAAEVAAATDGPLRPDGGLQARFHLVDGEGHWIWNEGVPADIPVVDGARVVLLDPLAEARTWEAGRQFAQMVPTIRLDHELDRDEAAIRIVSVPTIATPQHP